MYFKQAKPIWLKGSSNEINIQAGFVAKFICRGKATLSITGATLYRVYINGEFVIYGPARAPHGYARVDKLDISRWTRRGDNTIAIEVAGYNCFSYYTIKGTSFIQAEICDGDNVLCSTGCDFKGAVLNQREQKVMRYSYQRTFTEVWHLRVGDFWDESYFGEEFDMVNTGLKLLPRGVPVPNFEYLPVKTIHSRGAFSKVKTKLIKPRFITPSERFTGFHEDIIKSKPYYDLQTMNQKIEYSKQEEFSKCTIASDNFFLFDMGRNVSGFIKAEIRAVRKTRLLMYFDERLSGGVISPEKWSAINILECNLEEGEIYDFESFECYGFKYLAVAVIDGEINLESLGVREYKYPLHIIKCISADDEEIQNIYFAAIETFCQNTIDVFMDCPTRERAGWLCDSYFTAQAAFFLTGNTDVERVFMENFVLGEKSQFLPEGILPMCYPADHTDGIFIPQWSMWYIIQLEGYLKRNINANPEFYRDLCYKLLAYLDGFVNGEGLLENLLSWNFIEWSKANEWAHDVNYPTNMLYSKVLNIIGKLYNDSSLLLSCDSVRNIITERSFDGRLFVDNALRNDNGELINTCNYSETCQYYAFFFEVADIKDSKYEYLRNIIFNVFGPERREKNTMPEIEFSNVLMGIYMRMELLLRWEKYDELICEIKKYFGGMAKLTGTLWEHNDGSASLNHGFASYVGFALNECVKNKNK